jgi:hypothetical protein
MNTIFFALGTGFPTVWVTVIDVGRLIACVTTCWAAATPPVTLAAFETFPVTEPPELLDPQAAAVSETATMVATHATRRAVLGLALNGCMSSLLIWDGDDSWSLLVCSGDAPLCAARPEPL